jgi:hypothetical protein
MHQTIVCCAVDARAECRFADSRAAATWTSEHEIVVRPLVESRSERLLPHPDLPAIR